MTYIVHYVYLFTIFYEHIHSYQINNPCVCVCVCDTHIHLVERQDSLSFEQYWHILLYRTENNLSIFYNIDGLWIWPQFLIND
jgi:hypothetical protein